jgi:hypothetical protein
MRIDGKNFYLCLKNFIKLRNNNNIALTLFKANKNNNTVHSYRSFNSNSFKSNSKITSYLNPF